MTPRPMVDPVDLPNIDLAEPRLHAEHELDEVWHHLRDHEPVYWHPARDGRPGFWVITRHDDVNTVHQDKTHFTTERGNALATLLNGGDSASGAMLAVTDGPRHHHIRKVLMRGFSPRTLDLIATTLQQTVDRQIGRAHV